MGCNSSKLAKQTVSLASNGSRKSSVFIKGNTRMVNVEGPDSGRGSSAYTSGSELAQNFGYSSTLRPPHHIPKMSSGQDDQCDAGFNKGLVTNISTASKGIAYELKVDQDEADGTSIIKSHPPRALRRLEVPQNVKANYQKLMQDLQEADERKARLMKERREQCQSRRTSRNMQTETRRTSLEFSAYPQSMVTNVEIVHG